MNRLVLYAVILAIVGALAIVVIHLWGSDLQEQQTITSVITFLGPMVAAILALAKSVDASQQSRKNHESINGINKSLDRIINGGQ